MLLLLLVVAATVIASEMAVRKLSELERFCLVLDLREQERAAWLKSTDETEGRVPADFVMVEFEFLAV